MKKSLLLLVSFVLSGCIFLPEEDSSSLSTTSIEPTSVSTSEVTSESTTTPTSEPTTQPTSKPTSEPTSYPTSQITSETSDSSTRPTRTSTESTSQSTSSSTSKPSSSSSSAPSSSSSSSPVITIRTISDIKKNGKDGEIVKFDATYIRQITLVNEDLMYFADANDTIWMRVAYADFTGYLANRYHMKEYRVTGVLSIKENYTEILYSSEIGKEQSVTNLGDDYPLSYNKETTPISVSSIAEIKAKSVLIEQDKKGFGAGEIVKFTSQFVQREEDDGGIKAMVLDADGNSITTIADGKKLVNADDVGKYFEWVGIISIRYSIPAILAISATYVSTSEEVDVSNAVTVSPSYFAKWNLTSDKWAPAGNDDYYKLYKCTGYVKDNIDITTSFNIGMVDKFSDTLSDAGSKNTVKGFYFVNGTGLSTLNYSVFQDYVDQNIELTIYVKIESYVNKDHLWKMFVIEGLVPEKM